MMKSPGDRSLLVGAILVALIVSALTWFFGISPKLAAAQEAKAAAEQQVSENSQLQYTLDLRIRDNEKLPEYEAELISIRELMPPDEDIADARRIIGREVESVGMYVDSDSIGDPLPVLGGITLAAPMAAVGLTSQIEGMAFTTLVATPFSFDIVGSWDQVLAAVTLIQLDDHRYMLLSALTITVEDLPGGSLGYRASVSGYFFTLDHGVDGITVPPEASPWPGSEDGAVQPAPADNPFLAPVA